MNSLSPSICGADCQHCSFQNNCNGCRTTDGKPFGVVCQLAACCLEKKQDTCLSCHACSLKARLLDEINTLQIPDLPPITQLYALQGAFVNMAFPLPDGSTAKLLEDNRIYLGTQVPKQNSQRCYGIAADAHIILICEYGENGADPVIVLYMRRN